MSPRHSPKSPSSSLLIHDIQTHSSMNFLGPLGTRSCVHIGGGKSGCLPSLENRCVLGLLTVEVFPFSFTSIVQEENTMIIQTALATLSPKVYRHH